MATASKLDRRALVKDLLKDRGRLLVVTGLGAPTYDVAAAGENGLNFYLWGAMGSAAMVGLGLALARPQDRVAVITGDGEMLMGLGSLATIGVKAPRNLSIVILDNEHYGETGMQPTATKSGVDLAAMAKACRFTEARIITKTSEVATARKLLHSGKGPVLIQAKVNPDEPPRVLPSRDGHEVKLRFMHALAGKEK